MAQIDLNRIKRVEKERNYIHEPVFSTYTIFEKDNNKILQIDTYGKNSRETPEKISQSIQFDKKTAQFLVNLLTQEFGLK